MNRLFQFPILIFALSGFLHGSEPLGRFDRFVCDEGLKLIKKEFVVSYFEHSNLQRALEQRERLEDLHLEEMNNPKNAFYNEFKLSVIKNRQTKNYLVVDQICYTNNGISSQASVMAAMFRIKHGLQTGVIKAHTNRFSPVGNEQRDHLELIFEGLRH